MCILFKRYTEEWGAIIPRLKDVMVRENMVASVDSCIQLVNIHWVLTPGEVLRVERKLGLSPQRQCVWEHGHVDRQLSFKAASGLMWGLCKVHWDSRGRIICLSEEKVMLEFSLEGGGIPGRGNSMHKSPETSGMFIVFRKSYLVCITRA